MIINSINNQAIKYHILLLTLIFFLAEAKSQDPTPNKPQEILLLWDSISSENGDHFIVRSAEHWLERVDQIQSEDSTLILKLDYVRATIYFKKAQYQKCIPIYEGILSHKPQLDEEQLETSLVNLEEAYRRTGNLQKAIPIRKERVERGYDNDFFEMYEEAGLYMEAITEYKEHNPIPEAPLSKLGYYSRLGRLFNQDNQLDSAIYYYEMAFKNGIEIVEKDEYPGKSVKYHERRKYYTYQMRGEIGLIYIKQGKYQEAIPLLKKDIATCKEVGEVALTVPKRLGLAESYLHLEDLKSSKAHLDSVRHLTNEMDWFVHKVKFLKLSGNYYFQIGAYDQAATYFRKYSQLNDSIVKIQRENSLIATTAFLDNERQGKMIAEQRFLLEASKAEEQRRMNLFIGAILFALLIIGLVYNDARRKNKARKQALEDKQVIEEQASKIQELDKVKTRFFSNISHEFRTPLTLIQGPIQSILQGRISHKEAVQQNLHVAIRNVNNLKSLIDEILEFNNLELGKVEINNVQVDVLDYFTELSENYEGLINESGLKWSFQHDFEAALQLRLPINKIGKILHNLLSNAIKHSPKGGMVSLTASFKGSVFKVIVKDEGIGIKASEHAKIFERFYQASEGKLMPHSSGIGLAYVKEITEALGGTISLQSEIGQGTTFIFDLPGVKKGKGKNLPVEPKETDVLGWIAYPYANNKILLVEDNEEMASYIRQVLGSEFQITWAANGQEALSKLVDFDADLVISDIMMPVMTGIELLEKLKSDDLHKYRSVIMLTAKTNQATRLDALSFGLDDYLTKPFDPLELEMRVKNLLKNQFERKQWLSKDGEEALTASDPVITRLIEEIEKNIGNRSFGVLDLSNSAALSDRQLTRITKKSIGLTPASLIKEVKLQRAKYYLENKVYRSVAEVCYAVGFEKPSYFSKVFFDSYGKKPSSYFS